jgi:hypothetical protein
MHDDLLVVERRVEIREDPDRPPIGAADPVCLRRCPVFTAGAERAFVELRLGCLLDQAERSSRASAAVRGDRDEAPREWVSSKIQRGRGTA